MNQIQDVKQLNTLLSEADAIVIGIGSGMTSADKMGYSGDRFQENFKDFIDEFKFLDMLQASVYDFKDIQGKYNLLQCSKMCHNTLYSNDKAVYEMIEKQKDLKVDLNLIPRCVKCNAFLEVNKRLKCKGMVEDQRFFDEKQAYEQFIDQNKDKNIVFLEIGVGYATPMLIKHPFWEMVKNYQNSTYLTLNNKLYRIPQEIRNRTYNCFEDIKITIAKLLEIKNNLKLDDNE